LFIFLGKVSKHFLVGPPVDLYLAHLASDALAIIFPLFELFLTQHGCRSTRTRHAFVEVPEKPVHVYYAVEGQKNWANSNEENGMARPIQSRPSPLPLRTLDHESELMSDDLDVAER